MFRLRRAAGAFFAFSLLAGLFSVTGASASSTRSKLDAAKARLHQLEREIASENDRVHTLQGQLNVLAGKIDTATGKFQETQQKVFQTRDALARARDRYEALRGRLDEQARTAFMAGPGSGLELILSATSIADLSDRVEFVSSINQHDSDLANRVQNLANALNERKVELERLLARQARLINRYNRQRAELDAKFAEQKSLLSSLSHKQHEVDRIVSRLHKKLRAEELAAARAAAASRGGGAIIDGPGPFRTCPVDQPHAFGDSFGAPRFAGGYHPHAGNDIMAQRGTPIRAPFDGYAEASPNGLGGNAVTVRGPAGYVYNAHLDSYGQLGQVGVGTVIGYVGDTGDARGGPTHDHFEWHPDVIPAHPWVSPYGYSMIGTAIDPYPYLLQVC